MENYTQNKIDIIKDNKSYGILIEVGAGCQVYNELTTRPSTASKIVYYCESPNSWQYNNLKYNTSEFRAISTEVLDNIIYIHKNKPEMINANFILANTVQVANDKNTQTHGWFALHINDSTKYYHFSINGFKNRSHYNKLIAKIGLDILASENDVEKLDNGYIDQVLDNNRNQNKRETLTCILNGKLNLGNYHNTSTVFDQNNNIIRLNDLLRQNNELILFKGSFNPIHQHHLDLMNKMTIKKLSALPIFVISVSNRDPKKLVDVDNLLKRIVTINKLGYNVIIDSMPYYNQMYAGLLNVSDFNHKTNFVLGSDIMKRFLEDSHVECTPGNLNINTKFNIQWKNVTFWYSERSGYDNVNICSDIHCIKKIELNDSTLSSTEIRKHISENTIHLLEGKINNSLLALYNDIWK